MVRGAPSVRPAGWKHSGSLCGAATAVLLAYKWLRHLRGVCFLPQFKKAPTPRSSPHQDCGHNVTTVTPENKQTGRSQGRPQEAPSLKWNRLPILFPCWEERVSDFPTGKKRRWKSVGLEQGRRPHGEREGTSSQDLQMSEAF